MSPIRQQSARSATRSSSLLKGSDLAVNYGSFRALDGVGIEIARGEFVALAGSNGAGKTTLVRCLAGDITPNSGEITFDGHRLPSSPAAVTRLGITVVWQDLALCNNLDIAQNLALGRERKRILASDARVHLDAAKALNKLGIELGDTSRSVASLSGGQRQLLALARVMQNRPKLLILDEPTSALDLKEALRVEDFMTVLRQQMVTVLLISHDIDQMLRLADRVVVLSHGRVAGEMTPSTSHPDDLVALMSGQEVNSSARRQLTRLHGLVDRLSSAAPSSSLSLILSALAAALGAEQVCIHILDETADEQVLRCVDSIGLPVPLLKAWNELPMGWRGGTVGIAAESERVVNDSDAQAGTFWTEYKSLLNAANIRSSLSVPVAGPDGLVGIVSVFRPAPGMADRDTVELMTLYSGYAASAIERDRLLKEAVARSAALETIKDVLKILAGPVPFSSGLNSALRVLGLGIHAEEVALYETRQGQMFQYRGGVDSNGIQQLKPSEETSKVLERALAMPALGTGALEMEYEGELQYLIATLPTPEGGAALIAKWNGVPPESGATVMEDAAHSLRLAMEREEAELAHRETEALRRSEELERHFLTRLSHELRTPLTAIRGYASSLLQTDVTWDIETQERFLARIASESARLGRLVDDLLDFSAIEAGIFRMQPDWCDIVIVLEAAIACLHPLGHSSIQFSHDPDLPAIWGDHDRLEQVFVNLIDNAIRHNAPGTRVTVGAAIGDGDDVIVRIEDDGEGLPYAVAAQPFEHVMGAKTTTSGAGLGLSISRAIMRAHRGKLLFHTSSEGTCFEVVLAIEADLATGTQPPIKIAQVEL